MTNDYSTLTTFDPATISFIVDLLNAQHQHLAQLDRGGLRTHTARNYDSSIRALGDYMTRTAATLPTKSMLEYWRDAMLAGTASDPPRRYSVRTVNARLAAVRKLLRGVADDVTDIRIKLVLRDWAAVADAKTITRQDKINEDYGIRLTLDELTAFVNTPDTSHLKGLRDRALIAVMAGAGLRLSEAVALTLRDVFLTENDKGQRGIRVRRGKHHKSRIVVLGNWNHWVLAAVKAYTSAVGLTPQNDPEARIFRGVRRLKDDKYVSRGIRLSSRNAQVALAQYLAPYKDSMIYVTAHDLRRTYARLCKSHGMSWEALRENMGHSSLKITEDYVGFDVDWGERIPGWTVDLNE